MLGLHLPFERREILLIGAPWGCSVLETILSPQGLFVVGPVAAHKKREQVLPLQVCLTRSTPMGAAFHFQILQRGLNSYRKDCRQGKRRWRAADTSGDSSVIRWRGGDWRGAFLHHCQQSLCWWIWERFCITSSWILDASLQDWRHHLSFTVSSPCSSPLAQLLPPLGLELALF